MRLRSLACLLAIVAGSAHAGLFDDEEARRQIADLKAQLNERIEQLDSTYKDRTFDQANQIETVRADVAKLRGQLEVLAYEVEQAKKRQQDFYIDLDTRLRKIEAAAAAAAAKPAEEAAKPKADPAAETRDYEAALNLFKVNKYRDAAAAFDTFGKTYPQSDLAPSAQYWLGNAWFALRDCKRTIEAHSELATKWPDSQKAPDALLSVAACQQELGDPKSSRHTLESVVARYPTSPAADTARQKLKKK